MASTSTGWSCGTLHDGVVVLDLNLEEQQLLKQLEEPHECCFQWGTFSCGMSYNLPLVSMHHGHSCQELDEEMMASDEPDASPAKT